MNPRIGRNSGPASTEEAAKNAGSRIRGSPFSDLGVHSMKAKYKISCAVAAILWGSAGFAHADPTAASANAEADVAGGGIEEITVTAERRDQSVEKVPMTVQALTGKQLSDMNVLTLDDLLKYTPNVTYGSNGPGQGEIFMRGLSMGFRGNQSSGTIANFPNVAIYLDEQSMSFPARNVDIYMVDMERLEVLEGPQGTLFGGGAEAGAVRYITNKPDLTEFSAKAEAMYGTTEHGDPNDSQSVVLNAPLIDDKLAVRLVIYNERQGGYIDSVPATFSRSNEDLGNYYWGITPTGTPSLCPNGLPAGSKGLCTPGGVTINNQASVAKAQNPVTYEGARLSVLYKIDEDWDFLVAESLQSLDAQGLSVEYPYSSQLNGNSLIPLAPLQVTAFEPSYNKDSFVNTAWTLNGKIGDIKAIYTGGWTMRHVSEQMDYTNYSRSGGGMYYQCVGGTTGWPGAPGCYSPAGYWDDTIRASHLNQEVRFSTPDDWRFRAIVGGYYEQFRIYDNMDFNYKTLPACPTTGPLPATFCVGDVETWPGTTANDPGVRSDSTAFGEDTQRGYDQTAFFGDVDFDIIPKALTVTAGTRWYEYREFELGSEYQTTTGCANVNICDNAVAGGGQDIDAHNDHVTYSGFKSRAGVNWNIDDDTMVYYLFSQGFRPGAFNRGQGLILDYGPGKTNPQFNKPNGYRPDSLVNNEIGLKTLLLDDRLQLNLSAYAMRWDNVQMLFFNPAGGFGNTTFGLNGPSINIKGMEIQAVARPTDGLTLQGSTSYNNDTQASSPCFISNVSSSPTYGQCITSVKGVPLANPFGALGSTTPFSPKWEANFQARYDWAIESDYLAFARAGVSFEDSMYNQPSTYPTGTGVIIPGTTFLRYLQPAYTTFDAGLGISHDRWNAEIFGENLGDSYASTFTSSAQFIKSEVPLRPRVIGIKVSFSY